MSYTIAHSLALDGCMADAGAPTRLLTSFAARPRQFLREDHAEGAGGTSFTSSSFCVFRRKSTVPITATSTIASTITTTNHGLDSNLSLFFADVVVLLTFGGGGATKPDSIVTGASSAHLMGTCVNRFAAKCPNLNGTALPSSLNVRVTMGQPSSGPHVRRSTLPPGLSPRLVTSAVATAVARTSSTNTSATATTQSPLSYPGGGGLKGGGLATSTLGGGGGGVKTRVGR